MTTIGEHRSPRKRSTGAIRWLFRALFRLVLAALAAVVLLVLAYRWIDPATTPYILSEGWRLGQVERSWVDIEEVAPVLPRALVAAEDANFCLHRGFDLAAIRAVIEAGEARGASTITQQVVKNVFLWQGRSWLRKGLEAGLTPLVETLWPKRRILEVYMNVAETGEGIFGVGAAAGRRLGTAAAALSPAQAARLAVVLPDPKRRDPAALSPWLRRLAERVREGAATIRADGRSACFED